MTTRKTTERIPNPRSLANLRRGGGRPKGVPNKVTAAVKALAQEHTAESVNFLVATMRDAKAPHAVRMAAVREILDRGHGRPAQAITGAEGGYVGVAITTVVHEHIRP